MKILLASLSILVTLGLSQKTFAQFGTSPVKPKGFQLYSAPQVGKWFLPRNNLHLQGFRESVSHVSQDQFNQIIDNVLKYWQPLAAARGANLVAEKLWDDETVNAFASREGADGNTWMIHMFGGLARRPEMTPDGFALVVCHELGHHFGGYAYMDNKDWASAEGQSDYFATSVCAKVIWSQDMRQNLGFRGMPNLPHSVQAGCAQAYPSNTNAQGWCVRVAAASQSLANLLAEGAGRRPDVSTPDPTVVKATYTDHPNAQCRLDTLIAGSLCTKTWDPKLIPGLRNPQGQVGPAAEAEAMKYSCFAKEGYTIGTRPLCWFKPLIQ